MDTKGTAQVYLCKTCKHHRPEADACQWKPIAVPAPAHGCGQHSEFLGDLFDARLETAVIDLVHALGEKLVEVL